MIVYTTTVLLACFFAKLKVKPLKFRLLKKKYSINICLAAIPFIITASLRYNVGTDYSNYTVMYPQLLDQGYDIDPIFRFIIFVSRSILGNTHFIVVIFAIITYLCTFSYFKKYSDDLIYSIILFFLLGCFNYSLNIMRQMAVGAIFFSSISHIEEKNWKAYYVKMLIAFLIHKIAIILLPLYFIDKVHLKKWMYVIMPIGIFLISPYIRNVLMVITKKFNFYYGYFNNKYDSNTASYSLLLVTLIGILSLIIPNWKSFLNEKGIEYTITLNTQYICFLFACLIPIIPNGERFVFMFLPVECIAIPSMLKCLKKKWIKLLLIILLLSVFAYFFYSYFWVKGIGNTFPYVFII